MFTVLGVLAKSWLVIDVFFVRKLEMAYMNLFNIDGFMPHGHCFYWIPQLLWTLVISDAVITLSYYAIPFIILYIIRNRLQSANHEVKLILIMFGLFIFACGTTHLFSIITIWYPNYWLSAFAKLITAIVSLLTAIMLIPILRKADTYVLEKEVSNEVLKTKNIELNMVVEQFSKQKKELTILSQMSDYMQASNTLGEITSALINTMVSLWSRTSGVIYILNQESNIYIRAGEWGHCNAVDKLEPNECWSYRLGRTFPDISSHDTITCQKAGCSLENTHFCYPVITGGQTVAILHTQGIHLEADSHHNDIMSIICERLGLAIYNLQLKDYLEYKSTRDALTGLPNRQYMEQSLKTEIKRANREGKPLTIAFIDIDYFKNINDNFGHDTGDKILQHFSKTIQHCLRGGDIACRYGGEEFLVIYPNTAADDAKQVLERVAGQLHGTLDTMEHSLELSFSAGIAEFERHGSTYEELIKQADKAVYKAKENGRNRIEFAE